LEGIRGKLIGVVKDVVMGRTRGSLQTSVRIQEEVELRRMGNVAVHNTARADVATAVLLAWVVGKESNMMALLNNDKGDGLMKGRITSKDLNLMSKLDTYGFIVWVDLTAGFTDGSHLCLQHVLKLTF
jgi:hypothetical protein